MNGRNPALYGSLAMAVPGFAFLYFTHAADRAMDKSGLGDVAKWDAFNYWAGLSLWLSVAVWGLLVIASVWMPVPARSQVLVVCALAPFALLSLLFFGVVGV